MTRSADGGISRQRQRRKERTERCDWLQPAEKPDAQGRMREGKRKDFGLNVAYRRQQGPVLSICGDLLPLRRRASSKMFSRARSSVVWIVNNSYFTRSSVMGDDDVWQIEALRKTNLIGARRRGVDAMRILGQEAS